MEADDFDPSYYNLSKASAYRAKFNTHFPWVDRTVLAMPDWALIRMGQGPAQLVKRKEVCEINSANLLAIHTYTRQMFKANIRKIRESVGKGIVERETIFHAVLSRALPPPSRATTVSLMRQSHLLVRGATPLPGPSPLLATTSSPTVPSSASYRPSSRPLDRLRKAPLPLSFSPTLRPSPI